MHGGQGDPRGGSLPSASAGLPAPPCAHRTTPAAPLHGSAGASVDGLPGPSLPVQQGPSRGATLGPLPSPLRGPLPVHSVGAPGRGGHSPTLKNFSRELFKVFLVHLLSTGWVFALHVLPASWRTGSRGHTYHASASGGHACEFHWARYAESLHDTVADAGFPVCSTT